MTQDKPAEWAMKAARAVCLAECQYAALQDASFITAIARAIEAAANAATEREKKFTERALWALMRWTIERYLLVNSRGRGGAEKAELHLTLSYMLLEVLTGMNSDDRRDTRRAMIIHDATQSVTDNLDRFGFDFETTHQSPDVAKRVFQAFIEAGSSAIRKGGDND